MEKQFQSKNNTPPIRRNTPPKGYPILSAISTLAIGSVLWTLCVPGILPPTGMQTSQFFWFLAFSGLCTIANLALLITTYKSKLPPQLHWGDLIAILFVVYILLNNTVKGDPTPRDAWEIGLLFALYLNMRLFTAATGQKHAANWLAALLLLIGIVQIYIGFGQLYGYISSNHNRFNITGTFHNPAPLGGFLAMVLSVALYQISHSYSSVVRRFDLIGPRSLLTGRVWILILSCLFTGGALLLLPATQSRIAWLAAIIAGGLALLNPKMRARIRQWIDRHRKLALILGLALAIVSVTGIWSAYRMKADSADGRWLMWKTTAAIIADHPVTGVGANHFGGLYGDYQAAYFASEQGSPGEIRVAGSTGAAFNDYLQIGAEFGLIGILLFGGLIALAFRGYGRSGGGLAFALIALLIYACASYPLQLLSFRILWVVLVAVGISGLHAGRTSRNDCRVPFIVWGIVCAIGLWSLWQAWPLQKNYQEWKRLQSFYQIEDYEAIRPDYARLLPTLDGELQFLFESANILNKTGDYAESNSVLQTATRLSSDPMIYNLMGNNYKALGDSAAAERAYWRAYYVIPNRIYPLYLLTELYAQSGQEAKMRAMGRRVLDFEEKVPSSAVREIKSHVRKLLE